MSFADYIALSRRIWRLHLVPVAAAFLSLTSAMLLNQFWKQLPKLQASGAPTGAMFRVFALSFPFIVAMTLPLAVFVGVLRVFTRRPRDRDISALEGPGITPPRLVGAVVAGASLLSGLALVFNAYVVPWSNHQLRPLLVDIQQPGQLSASERTYKGDREMTIGELRQVVSTAREDAMQAAASGNAQLERAARLRRAVYAVEIQKKYAISAACLILAFCAVTLGLRIGRAGWPVVASLSLAVFSLYYVSLIGGEELGDRLMMSPFLAMWIPNLVLGTIGLILLLWPNTKVAAHSAHVDQGKLSA